MKGKRTDRSTSPTNTQNTGHKNEDIPLQFEGPEFVSGKP